jgi:hypothetical protein
MPGVRHPFRTPSQGKRKADGLATGRMSGKPLPRRRCPPKWDHAAPVTSYVDVAVASGVIPVSGSSVRAHAELTIVAFA